MLTVASPGVDDIELSLRARAIQDAVAARAHWRGRGTDARGSP